MSKALDVEQALALSDPDERLAFRAGMAFGSLSWGKIVLEQARREFREANQLTEQTKTRMLAIVNELEATLAVIGGDNDGLAPASPKMVAVVKLIRTGAAMNIKAISRLLSRTGPNNESPPAESGSAPKRRPKKPARDSSQ
jgi:hypothetical protein